MDLGAFTRQHKPLWSELEQLLARFGKRKGRIAAEDVDRLTALYKSASSHLAALRTYRPNDETTQYLNHLVSRAHHAMYQESNKSSAQLRHFFGRHLIGLVRERRLFIILALVLFAVGGLSGYIAVWQDPANAYAVLPAGMADSIDPAKTELPRGDIHSPVVSTEIMTNNIRVAVLAFVSGITLGVGTVYLMLYNGLLIGALAAVFMHSGKSYVFWAYILPHGVIELTAIFIAGGAGFYMAYRMIVPTRYSRKYEFLQAAKQSAQLLIGTIPLFVIAGIIEGYITPSVLSLEVKYAVAGATLLLLAAYYAYGIRSARAAERENTG
ncbi:stage II sporulation protein M [Paenibacillus sp. MBLB4367]|uniref:stage II sporulation protein M n=1 Tax=Paenibacillus sp. MBLB4367 TaxID=3384767 RepID=UPI0039081987